MPKKEDIKISTLSNVLLSTHGYIEPTLHIIVKLPNNHLFLYIYKDTYPKAIQLPEPPESLCQHQKEEFLMQTIKIYINDSDTLAHKQAEVIEVYPDIWNVEASDDCCRVLSQTEDQEHINCDTEEQSKCYVLSNKYLSGVKNRNLILENNDKSVSERRFVIENIRNELIKDINTVKTLSLRTEHVNFSKINEQNTEDSKQDIDMNCKDHNDNITVARQDVNVNLISEHAGMLYECEYS